VVLNHIPPSDKAPEQEIVHAKFVVGADGEICSNLDTFITNSASLLRCTLLGSKNPGYFDGWGTDE